MGCKRTNFDPRNHMHDDHQGEAGEDAPQMHSSCCYMLRKIIGVTTGQGMFTLLHLFSAGTTEHVLCIDPYSVVMLPGLSCINRNDGGLRHSDAGEVR